MSRFKTKPFNHQLDCLNNYGNREFFALLAEMGTGKSWIIINNAASLWGSHEIDGLLILAPNGVHYNWTLRELPAHMPEWVRWRGATWSSDQTKKEKAQLEAIFSGTDSSELRVLTMNWEALQAKRGFEYALRFCNSCSKLMIVGDESTYIKNPSAERTKRLMKLKPYSRYRRIMNGTPITNSPFDAFSQFSFLDENLLGTTSYYSFKAEYAEMLPEGHHLLQHIVEKKTRMSLAEKQTIRDCVERMRAMILANGRVELVEILSNVVTACENEDFHALPEFNEQLRNNFAPGSSPKKLQLLQTMASIDNIVAAHARRAAAASNPKRLPQIVDKDKTGKKKYRNLEKLQALLAPHSFRVLKKDCLDLPKKIYKTVWFDLSAEQKEIYTKAAKECRLVLDGEETPIAKLAAIMKLAQITSGYFLHPDRDEPVRIQGENQKLQVLKERVLSVVEQERKVIVWARFRVEIEDIVATLEAEGLRVVQYHGGVNKRDRNAAIDDFQEGDADVFVGQQQSGGVGITLTKASCVIYFSNTFNLYDRLQSEDRAHRIGQEEDVVYINIVARNTIDQAIVGALSDKKDIADLITGDIEKLLPF